MTSRFSFTAANKGVRPLLTAFFLAGALALSAGCSSAPKKDPELSKYFGKKVALVSIDGETTARTIVEAALINQLAKRGTFEIIPQSDILKAKSEPDVDTTDDAAVAKRAGADYSLRARVLKLEAHEREGYDAVEEEDSQMKAETGESKTSRIYHVATLLGKVEVELSFRDLKTGETKIGIAKAEGNSFAESKYAAGHLPPKLSFLEGLANDAFRDFFDRYN